MKVNDYGIAIGNGRPNEYWNLHKEIPLHSLFASEWAVSVHGMPLFAIYFEQDKYGVEYVSAIGREKKIIMDEYDVRSPVLKILRDEGLYASGRSQDLQSYYQALYREVTTKFKDLVD